MARVLPILVACLLAFPVWAENASTFLDFGGDSFRAGRTVSHDRPETDDLFMAGETVLGQTNVGGTAHLAGREVTMEGDVGGDAYAAGEEITFRGSISGDATLVGREVSVALVGGDLRVAGSRLRLAGDIGGYAMVAGEDIAFDAAVAGDVSLAAKSVDWGEAASIAGRLVVYEEEPGELRVPERVVPADRIERRHLEEWEGPRRPNFGRAIAAFLLGVITVAAVAALIASLVPERLAEMRRQILSRPFHTLWLGFLTQATIIGSGVLLAMTIIGLLLTPAMVLLAIGVGFAGYVVAAYAFGVGILIAVGKPEPETISDRAMAAAVGALSAGIIGVFPLLGWLFVLALALSGIGAIAGRVIRPAFFADIK